MSTDIIPERRKALRELCDSISKEWVLETDNEHVALFYSENANEYQKVFEACNEQVAQAILDLKAAVPALLDALDRIEKEPRWVSFSHPFGGEPYELDVSATPVISIERGKLENRSGVHYGAAAGVPHTVMTIKVGPGETEEYRTGDAIEEVKTKLVNAKKKEETTT